MKRGDASEYLPDDSRELPVPPATPQTTSSARRSRPRPAPDDLPPHDPEAESAVLACILGSTLASSGPRLDKLLVSDFYELRHQTIFRALLCLRTEGRELTALELYQWLKAKDQIADAGGLDYLQRLPDLVPDPDAFESYYQTVNDLAYRRALLTETANLAALARDQAIDRAELRQTVQTISAEYCQEAVPISAKPIGDLQMPPDNDPTELLKYRFLCQRGGLLISGPTGMGKSSFLMQAYALWSNALPFLGIVPVRKMRCLLIQAENDDGDLAAMRDGICTGLQFTEEQRFAFFSNVLVHTSTGIVGKAFFTEVVNRLLDLLSPLDFCGIDPALSFVGGDVKEQKVVGEFLRTYFNPLLYSYNCAAPVLHHSNKPPSGKEKPNWSNGDMAYIGSGSAEWANWARAILSLQSSGVPGIYHLHAAKRGSKLNWKDPENAPAYSKTIAWAKEPNLICWREADPQDYAKLDSLKPKSNAGRKPKASDQEFLALFSPNPLSTAELYRDAFKKLALSKTTTYDTRSRLEKEGKLSQSPITQLWQPSPTSPLQDDPRYPT